MSEQLIFVKFGASWCGPCAQMAPVLVKVAQDYPNMIVMDVDVDELDNQDLITWAVTGIPTMFLYNDQGILIERFDGATPPVKILAAIREVGDKVY